MLTQRDSLFIPAFLSFLLAASPVYASIPSFLPLGPPPGANHTIGWDISADGSTVVGQIGWASGETEAFRWTMADGFLGLGDLSGGNFESIAYGVSADGAAVVGYSLSTSGQEAFRWTAGEGIQGLGDLPGGEFESLAFGVSADGSVVVGQSKMEGGNEAFRWTAATGMLGLGGVPGGDGRSAASSVSPDGTVVAGLADASLGIEAFRWTESGGMVALGDLPGAPHYSRAWGVSADGSTIVGSANFDVFTTSEAFRWTESDGMVGLGFLPGGFYPISDAYDVSADGSLIVGTSLSSSGLRAIIWDELNGMRDLNEVLSDDLGLDLSGLVLEHALAVSDDGNTFTGWAVNPAGQSVAWIATIPEPSTLVLLAFCAALSVRPRRIASR